MSHIIYTDGLNTKSFGRAINYPDEEWEFITEPPKTSDNELYASVAAIYRCANLCADAVGALPFAIVGRNGKDYDTSEDYKNKLGFLPDPQGLFRLWRMSLYFTNKAYGFMETVNGRNNLRYIVPTTITPVQSRQFPYELTGFKRSVGGSSVEYKLEDKRIVYIWKLDHTTELIPSDMSEFRAAATAAGVLYFADYYIQNFFARGGIKPTMLLVKGAINPSEREKIEGVWDKVVRGYYKFLGKIFNADAIEPHIIGEGIENLKDDLIYQNKLTDIAMASGIPLSLLLANSANYATAQTEYLSWFRDSVEPWADFIARQFTDQVLAPLGLHLDFRPELTDPGQESEVARADAYASYVSSGIKPSIAAQIVGIDLPPEVEYTDLDPVDEKPQPPAMPEADEQEQEEPQTPQVRSFVPTIEQLRELEFWQTLAFRKLKKGELADFVFRYRHLPEKIANAIQDVLKSASTKEEIEVIFGIGDVSSSENGDNNSSINMQELIDALNLAASALFATKKETQLEATSTDCCN